MPPLLVFITRVSSIIAMKIIPLPPGLNTGAGVQTGTPQICYNCQWFMITFMIISLHVVIIIKLLFEVNAQKLIIRICSLNT